MLVHPLMPTPEDVADAPSFIRIEAMERDPELKDVIKSMMNGQSGQKTLFSNRVAPAGDCNTVFMVCYNRYFGGYFKIFKYRLSYRLCHWAYKDYFNVK